MAPVQPQKRLTWIELLFCLAGAIYALWGLVRIITTSAPDFSVLYFSARHLLQGVSLYQGSALFTGLGYPPISVLPYIPFTWLPYTLAQAVWIVGSFIAFLACVFLCLRMVGYMSFRNWALVATLTYISFPSKFTFGMGQANYYALFLLLWGLSQGKHSVWIRASILAVALMLKPHFAFVYLGLLFTKHRLPALVSFGVVIVLSLILGIVGEWKQEWDYVHLMLPSLMAFSGREIYYNQGIQALVFRAWGEGARMVATVTCGVVFVSTWVRFLWMKKRDAILVLGMFLPMQILVEPLAWQHHLIFLLPTFVYLWFGVKEKHLRIVLHALLVIAYLLISSNIKNPLYWQENVLVLSHASIGVWITWLMALRFL